MSDATKLNEELNELARLNAYNKRFSLIESHKSNIAKLKEKISSQAEFDATIEKFVIEFCAVHSEIDSSMVNYLYQNTILNDCNDKEVVVRYILDDRNNFLNQFTKQFKAGKISKTALENVFATFGVEKSFRESLNIGEIGKNSEDNLTDMDGILIQRKLEQKELLHAIFKTMDGLIDYFYIPWLNRFDSFVERSFNDQTCAEYMHKIFKNAANQLNKQGNKIEKCASIRPAIFEENGEPGYIELSYRKNVQKRVSQSLADYSKNGAKYETVIETRCYNPQEIQNALPENVSLVEEDSKYYLQMQGRKIVLEDLQELQNEYENQLNDIENSSF